jgi:hypothetical protein
MHSVDIILIMKAVQLSLSHQNLVLFPHPSLFLRQLLAVDKILLNYLLGILLVEMFPFLDFNLVLVIELVFQNLQLYMTVLEFRHLFVLNLFHLVVMDLPFKVTKVFLSLVFLLHLFKFIHFSKFICWSGYDKVVDFFVKVVRVSVTGSGLDG